MSDMAYDMNAHMKGKYTTDRPMTSQPYHPRTGNTHASNRKPLRPCTAAPAGAKVFQPDPQPKLPGVRTLVWDMQAGTKKFMWLDGQGRPVGGQTAANQALAGMGLQ